MLARTREDIKIHPLQCGFAPKCSLTTCALLETEAIAEARDQTLPLHIIFRDAKKAFDLVSHETILKSLISESMPPHFLLVYNRLYEDITSRMKLDGSSSRKIKESQGIGKGSTRFHVSHVYVLVCTT